MEPDAEADAASLSSSSSSTSSDEDEAGQHGGKGMGRTKQHECDNHGPCVRVATLRVNHAFT